jgi:hypothetical protein
MIGSALVSSLQADGVDVLRVVRHAPGAGEVQWDPSAGTLTDGGFDNVDAVVHLAGEPVEKRWNDEQKRKIRESRVNGTHAVAHACATAKNGPSVLVSGSAIGFYGDTGETVVDESGPVGSDFLAGVVHEWEAATAEAEAAGVRVVHARTGIVQSTTGGMLKKQLIPFKLGVGGKIGSGAFWLSWVSLDDEVRALRFAIDTPTMRGAVNLTAPNPVTNATYTKALGAAVHRPTFMVIPPAALTLAMGAELVESLLVSQRVLPKRLLDAGFTFMHPTITEGLQEIVRT